MDEFGSDKYKRGQHKMRLPQLSALLLLLAGIASAQTTAIQPGICVHLQNCVLYDTAGHTVWSDLTWNSTTGNWGGFMEYGIYPNLTEYTNLVQYPVVDPVDPQPLDINPILYSVQFRGPDGTTYTQVLKGYSYYSRGSGGRGCGGCGTRYAVTSGSITIN